MKLAFHLDPSRARSGIDFEGFHKCQKKMIKECPSVIHLEFKKLTRIKKLGNFGPDGAQEHKELHNLFDLTQILDRRAQILKVLVEPV